MGKPHALIIDDNQKNLGVMAQMLQLEGVDSTKVPNPNQLASILDQLAQVDVIFLDLEMPGLDGYAVLEQLKADPRFNAAPIVAYTVHVSEVNTAYQHGFDSFIGKPLNSDKFPEQLNRILNGESVWETS